MRTCKYTRAREAAQKRSFISDGIKYCHRPTMRGFIPCSNPKVITPKNTIAASCTKLLLELYYI
jgi:hypothetical protein